MLTTGQLSALVDACEPRYRAAVLLAAWAGLRFGELAALRRSRLDLDAQTVTISEAASDMPQGVRHIGPP